MLLSPWSEIKGFNFDPTPETDHFFYEFKQDMDEKRWESNDKTYSNFLSIESDSKQRYFEVLNNMAELNGSIKVYYTPTDHVDFIVEDEEDIDAPKES